jgi:hypothetical protein
MRRLGHLRPLRKRIFVGCEGRSEESYIALIRTFAEAKQLPIHLEIKNLAPAGDPLDRLNTAIKCIARLERNREKFATRFVILDDDQNDLTPQRTEKAKELAIKHSISLIWQSPCHEAMLLRHFENHGNDQPQSTPIAKQQLKALWPEYVQGMERLDLAKRLDFASVASAAAVEHDLAKFLKQIGL